MKNIRFFSNTFRPLFWFLMIAAGYFILIIPYSCKEETFAPESKTMISSRDGGEESHLDLLGISCFPDSILTICDSFPSIDSMYIMLADYPGCSFLVAYEFYDCRNDSTHYYLGDYHIVSHNCSAFTTALNVAYGAGGATLAAFVENFDHDVYLKIKTNLANTLVSMPCERGYVTFVSYIRVSCFKTCYYTIGHTMGSKKVACGSDCCAERTRACRNDSGGLVLTSSYETSYPPHCSGPIIYPTEGLPVVCTSETACGYTCPE